LFLVIALIDWPSSARIAPVSRPRIVGLSDLKRKEAEAAGDDGDGPQTMYAGGEKSGMAIEGGPRPEHHQLIRNILEKASRG
jgi:UBX domain-containing protein 1